MLSKEEQIAVLDFIKTSPVWKIFKKMFTEREQKLLKFIAEVDLDDENQKKFFKQKQFEIKAFKTFIAEIESLEREKQNQEYIDEYNKTLESEINWWTTIDTNNK